LKPGNNPSSSNCSKTDTGIICCLQVSPPSIKIKTKEEVIGKSDMEEIEKWSKVLINENSHYFIARTTYKNQKMKLLINTKR